MNYMEKVAKMFGVELGEEFGIVFPDNSLHATAALNENGLYVIETNVCNIFDLQFTALNGLLNGSYDIKRKPWKPKDGDVYWYVCADGDLEVEEWLESAKEICDMNTYKLGNCYRTEKEAEANKDKWIKFYASDDVLEV